ncbi:MAG: FKBP-type peptidyl-prolyl cis-trans isomerase [Desulfosarcina sp.]|jgi:peptidylprolyl isomerase
MRTVQDGDTVRIHFTCNFDDGSEIASTIDEEPLELTIGEGKLVECFEKSVIGMTEGQKKTVHLQPQQAMGKKNPELISKVPLHLVSEKDEEIEVGSRILVKDNYGNDLNAIVTKISDQTVTVDANHPLAGEALTFNIELIEFL